VVTVLTTPHNQVAELAEKNYDKAFTTSKRG